MIVIVGLFAFQGFAQEAENRDEILAELQGAPKWDEATT
jgi:hypothetical protein